MYGKTGMGAFLGLIVWGGVAWGQDQRPVPRPDRAVASVVMSSKSPTPRPENLSLLQKVKPVSALATEIEAPQSVVETDPVITAAIAEWQRLRKGGGSFAEYRAFLAKHDDWPGLELLRERGEASITPDTDPAQVIAYFTNAAPQSGKGALRLAAAYLSNGDKARAEAVLIAAWTGLELSESLQEAFLEDHRTLLKPHHAARLDFLLWQKERSAATRMLPLVDDGQQAVAKARMALQREDGGVDTLIASVPKALARSPGLGRDRMEWQIAKRRRDSAADVILDYSASAETLGRPEAWASWRAILARQAMRDGDGKRAYALASSHHMTDGSAFADLEWLSGYLALTYLDKPDAALAHFKSFDTAVFTPISQGRAGYWQGRALEAMGDAAGATAAYTEGAKYQTSFYGLLAAEKAGVPMDRTLTGLSGFAPWKDAGFTKSSLFLAAEHFHNLDQNWEATRFLGHLTASLEPNDRIKLADYTLSLGDPFLAVKIGKSAAYAGTVAPRAYYPLRRMGDVELPVPEALALSIARRESEFHAAAVSHAGARGLMQLMPGTAKQMAGKIGLPYSKSRLTSDPSYNIQLGSAYLAHLIEEFGNNIVLVSVGYNAGPHRARKWIETYGDPRDPDVDVVDWIEHIPFNETRNYVMRVAESLPVYRARLSGRVVPIDLLEELKAK